MPDFKPGDGVKYAKTDHLLKLFSDEWGFGPFEVTEGLYSTRLRLKTADGKILTMPNSAIPWDCSADGLVRADFELAVYRRRHGASVDESAAEAPNEPPCATPEVPVKP